MENKNKNGTNRFQIDRFSIPMCTIQMQNEKKKKQLIVDSCVMLTAIDIPEKRDRSN